MTAISNEDSMNETNEKPFLSKVQDLSSVPIKSRREELLERFRDAIVKMATRGGKEMWLSSDNAYISDPYSLRRDDVLEDVEFVLSNLKHDGFDVSVALNDTCSLVCKINWRNKGSQ
jgi:hypothetical protein